MFEMVVYCSAFGSKVSIVQEYKEEVDEVTRVSQKKLVASYCRFQKLCKIEDCFLKIGKSGNSYIASRSE